LYLNLETINTLEHRIFEIHFWGIMISFVDETYAVTTAMEYIGGVGECPHAGVLPPHPVPHPSEKRYIFF
jgi:hypothetical protein